MLYFFLTHYSFVGVGGLCVIERWTLGEFSVASVGLASPVDADVSSKKPTITLSNSL